MPPLSFFEPRLKCMVKGNSTFAGGAAAFMANVVLIAYVIVAMKTDQGEQPGEKGEGKKGQ